MLNALDFSILWAVFVIPDPYYFTYHPWHKLILHWQLLILHFSCSINLLLFLFPSSNLRNEYNMCCCCSSVTKSCPTLCNPMGCSMPGSPVLHYPRVCSNHVHWVGDAIQPSYPLSSPSPAFNLSHPQGLFKWVNSSRQVAKVLQFQFQHNSFQWIFRTDFL